jgi:hypothetical protein
MKKFLRLLLVTLAISPILTGCYYDKESELYPSTTCGDTVLVTYTQSIVPIMVANCNVCHSAVVASGGVVTDSYSPLTVVAGNGALWASVNHENAFPMPQGLDKLSVCDLTKIKKWIDAGYPNN